MHRRNGLPVFRGIGHRDIRAKHDVGMAGQGFVRGNLVTTGDRVIIAFLRGSIGSAMIDPGGGGGSTARGRRCSGLIFDEALLDIDGFRG